MKQYETANIRNVAFAGHSGAGKTALAEALLFRTEGTDRLGNATDGNTVSDYDPQEVKRQHSIATSLLPVEYKGGKINILDVPGRLDFIGEIKNSVRVADGLLLVVDATGAIGVGAEFVWEFADEYGLTARAVFINKLDKDQGDFDKALAAIGQAFPRRVVPVTLPVGKEADFKGVVDLVKMKFISEEGTQSTEGEIPAEMAEAAAEARAKLVESAADGDEELMMKFLEDEPLTDEEVIRGLKGAIAEGLVLPVACGSAATGQGVASLLDLIADGFPNPLDGPGVAVKKDEDEEEEKFAVSPDGPALLFIFKTVSDPYAGHLSFFKVMQGEARSESSVTNLNKGKSERIAHVLVIKGKQHENIDAMASGDLGAVGKLDATHTGDTLAADGAQLVFSPTRLPPPNVRMCIEPKAKADEEKIGIGFRRLTDQDPTLHLARDPEIHQTIVSGMGDTHLDVAVGHLKELVKIDVELKIPKVPYRETLTKKAEGQGKYKKQSGGRGQYGDCWIKLEPIAAENGFEFEWAIVGGVIPTKFQPSVEKGLLEALGKGVLSGHPTVGVKATCYDGSHHAVDSSEMAFKVAASMAFKNVAPLAKPVILEPICKVKVTVPEQFMGDVMGDMSGRRGRIQGTESHGRKQVIEATVPQSEMFTYSRELRSMTRGTGIYEMEFDRYERVPGEVQEKIIAEAQAGKDGGAS